MTALTVPGMILRNIELRGWYKGEDESDLDGTTCLVTAVIGEVPDGERHATIKVLAGVIHEMYPEKAMYPDQVENAILGEVLQPDWEHVPVTYVIAFNDNPSTKITHLRKVIAEAARRSRATK